MTKDVRLVDFQVYARPAALGAEHKPINEALFATYEPVRLWLKERSVKSAFQKVLVSVSVDAASSPWHGAVSVAAGVCEVTEAVTFSELRQNAGNHRWVLGIVAHALACVARTTGWHSDELDAVVGAMAGQGAPLRHLFEGLAKTDASGVKCVPWFAARPGETEIGVRCDDQDFVVLSKPGPLFLEEHFPVASTEIRGSNFLLLDKGGNTLGSLSIPTPHARGTRSP